MIRQFSIAVSLLVSIWMGSTDTQSSVLGLQNNLFRVTSNVTVRSSDGGFYNLTLRDCLSVSQDSAYKDAYPADAPFRNDPSPAWFKTYWTAQFNCSHYIVNITFKYGGVPNNFASITLHDSKSNSSYEELSNCTFNGNSVVCPGESILADKLTMTSTSSIFLNEIYVTVKTYIDVAKRTGLDIYSYISPEQRCWLMVIQPLIDLSDWCCLNLTLRLQYSDQIFSHNLSNFKSLLQLPSSLNVTTCPDAIQDDTIQLSLSMTDKQQRLVYHNMTYQYSHPDDALISALIAPVIWKPGTIEPNTITSRIEPSRSVTSINFDQLIINCTRCERNFVMSCENGCDFSMDGLEASTAYELMVYGVWKMATGLKIAGQTQIIDVTTRPCLEVYGYNLTSIKDLQPKSSTVEVGFQYRVLTVQCSTSNFSNTLIINAGYTTLSFICTGTSEVTCLAVVQPYTTYNVTLVTFSSIGMENTIINTWTSPERAPSAPQNVTYSLKSDENGIYYVLLNWAPPKYPNGVVWSYIIAYHIDEEAWLYDNISANQTTAKVTVILKRVLYYKIQSVTVSRGRFSKLAAIYIPADALPGVSNFLYTQLTSQNFSRCGEFSWSINNSVELADSQYYTVEISCRNNSLKTYSEHIYTCLPVNHTQYNTCELSHQYSYECSLYIRNPFRSQLVKTINILSTFPSGGRVIADHKLNSSMIAVIVGVAITIIIIAVTLIVAFRYRDRIKNRFAMYSQASMSDESQLMNETENMGGQHELEDDWSTQSFSNTLFRGIKMIDH